MIFRLEYCNKASVTARVDIQKGDATPIYTVEGTSEPFVLFYNNDKGDKSGSFRSSGADINIYETTEFNIDELKTSSETEISVKYYINNILNWSGFVIPDFFSETITGGQGVVSMVASDRLGTLKGATLSGLSAKVSNRALVDACLAQTGLSLPLYTMADFTGDGTNIFNSEVLSQRMVDTKGRNVSCYDILSSILEETNSLIVQRNGAWYIVNKLQLEAGSGSLYSSPVTSSAWAENTVSFDEVSVGARRTIIPVAATVGVYHEHGGGRLHPDNYDFSEGNTGWVASGGFPFTIATNQIVRYIRVNNKWTVDFGDTDKSRMQINKIYEGAFSNTDLIAYVSNTFPVISASEDSVKVEIDISVTGMPTTTARAIILADNGTTKFAFNPSQGAFEPYDPQRFDGGSHSVFFINMKPEGEYLGNEKYDSATKSLKYSAVLNATDVQDYSISIRFYGTDSYNGVVIPIFVNFASVKFSNTAELPKGNMFKTEQGANYTKDHEIPTVLWGDYLTSGLNGYFYDYPIDDTSSIYRPTGELHSKWTAYGDTDTLPLLQHITRQKARMFSVAHDLLSADIATSTFDPLSIFVDCDSTRYVVVSARFDFLRSNVSVELEEIEYVTNSKRDYIYSYFGDGEEGISSIGGITGGSAAGGGSSHSHSNKPVIDKLTQANIDVLSYLSLYQTGFQQTQLLDEFGDPVFDLNGDPVMIDVLVPVLDSFGNPVLDEYGDPVMETVPVYAIKSTASFFSEKEISAFGIGDGSGGGGGGGFDMLLAWDNYSPEKSQWVISAALGKGLLDRIVVLEDGGSGGGSTVTWGTESGGYVPLTVEGVSKSVALSTHTHSQYALTTHNHSGVYAPATHDHSGVYAPVSHNHSGVYEPVFSKNTAFNKDFGTTSGTVARGNHTHSEYALSTHNHSGVYEPVFTKNNAFNKDFGTTSGTVAEGNDSRIVNGQTAYGWGNHAAAGYALTTHNHSGVYEPVFTKNNAFNKDFGTTSTTVSRGNHAHSGVYEPAFTKNTAFNKDFGTTLGTVARGNHTHSGVYEPVFTKNTAFNKDFGTTSGTVALGNDSRIVNGQTAYSWGNHAAAGYALTTHNHSGVYEPVFTKNNAFNKDFGTTSGTVAEGNDSRIVNGQTAYGWGNHAAAGYALTTHNHSGVYAPVSHDHSGVYAPASHDHSGVYEPVFSKNTAFNKDFGTTSGTVAQGNDSRITNGQTAYGWGDHGSAGYATSSELDNYVTLTTTQTISGAKTFSAALTATVSVTTPKVIFAAAGWSLEQTGTELQMKYNGTTKMRFLSGGSIVATGEVTAFG